jgi:hypothetical protein
VYPESPEKAVKMDSWTESEGLFNLDVRKLVRYMSEISEIMRGLANVNIECIMHPKLLV